MTLPAPEQLLASAARYLLDGKEYDAASLLVACSLTVESVLQHQNDYRSAKVSIRCPRTLCDMALAVEAYWDNMACGYEEAEKAVIDSTTKTLRRIETAIKVVMPSTINEVAVSFRAQLVELDEDWRRELAEIARGKSVHNQATEAERVLIWANHRFRSQAEIRIAQALEKEKILFFPNCKARLGFSLRENREPDFLVCFKGKWGILEVDGELFHPPSRTVEDHERDRLFQAHGIKLVQHFDAGECFENAGGIVKKFLFLLERS